jgi:inosine/xanthosine triphosphate pyrophosphatase family protein
VRSARYAAPPGSGLAGRRREQRKLLRELPGVAPAARPRFRCAIVLVRHADDPEPLLAEGTGRAASRWRRAAAAASATTPCSSTAGPD